PPRITYRNTHTRTTITAPLGYWSISGYWSAQSTYDANVGEALSSPLEPAGSFVVSEMPDSSIQALALHSARG
ncbi:hypothetical protein ACLQ24_30605, partial [Micromonospora sp. DT4]|uniref:hypothetical protein n=1 Tax=Micromonospora sp. DT4 TaxID=3393438 RepID=UPI003CF07F48